MSVLRQAVWWLGWLSLYPLGVAGGEQVTPVKEEPAGEVKLSPLERKFQETMSAAVLVGRSTTPGADGGDTLNDERYTIRQAFKVADKQNTWKFLVRLQYGELDLSLPLELEVFWAGDTPVITLTNFHIPALGTFSARVLVHTDRYAGTWQHGKKGGHLFGRIIGERDPQDENSTAVRPDL